MFTENKPIKNLIVNDDQNDAAPNGVNTVRIEHTVDDNPMKIRGPINSDI